MYRIRITRYYLLLIFLFTGFKTASAQYQSLPLDSLFNLSISDLLKLEVTSATKTATALKDLPMTVHVITEQDIRANQYTSLVEILKDLPGIRVSQPGHGFDGDMFLVRGLVGNNYSKFLVDGIPINPYAPEGMPIDEQFNLDNLERIEVIYGPSASLYGADALALVINLVSKKDAQPGLKARTSIGQTPDSWGYVYGNVNGTIQIQDNVKALIYALYANRADQNIKDGYNKVFDPSTYYKRLGYGDSTFTFGKLPSKSLSFGAKIYLPHDMVLSYHFLHRKDHSSLQQTPTWYRYDVSDLFLAEYMQHISFQVPFQLNPKMTLISKLAYNRYRLDNSSAFWFTFEPQRGYKFMASDELYIEELINYEVNENFNINAGINYQYLGVLPKTNDLKEKFDPSDYKAFSTDKPPADTLFGHFGHNPQVNDNKAFFLQTTYSGSNYLALLGARYDSHSRYGDNLSPRAALLLKKGASSLRFSYTGGFKAPNPSDAYESIGLGSGTGVFYLSIPNPDLKPEKLDLFEAGIRYEWSKDYFIEAVAYHSRISDLISSSTVPMEELNQYPNPINAAINSPATSHQNGGSGILSGIDISLSADRLLNRPRLSTRFSLSIMKGKETLPNGDKINHYRQVPEWQGLWRIVLHPIRQLRIGFDQHFSGPWYAYKINDLQSYEKDFNKNDGFYHADLVINYKFPVYLDLYCKVINIFNAHYGGLYSFEGFEGSLDYNPQYNRTIYAGMQFYIN